MILYLFVTIYSTIFGLFSNISMDNNLFLYKNSDYFNDLDRLTKITKVAIENNNLILFNSLSSDILNRFDKLSYDFFEAYINVFKLIEYLYFKNLNILKILKYKIDFIDTEAEKSLHCKGFLEKIVNKTILKMIYLYQYLKLYRVIDKIEIKHAVYWKLVETFNKYYFINIINYIKNKGFDIFKQYYEWNGDNIVFMAINEEKFDILKYFFEINKESFFKFNNNGESLLFFARYNYELYHYLINTVGLDINLVNKEGKTIFDKYNYFDSNSLDCRNVNYIEKCKKIREFLISNGAKKGCEILKTDCK